MKIVFVNPPLTWEERYTVKRQSGGNTPPIGLAYLAAAARGRGYEAAIVDAAVLQMPVRETAERILSLVPDVVGFTAVTISIGNVVKVMEYLKSKRPGLIMVVGGAHMTAVPKETFERFETITLAAIGEAEETVIDLLDFLSGKGGYRSLEEIPGLALRKGREIFFTPRRERAKDLDSLPFPAWDLLPSLSKYYAPPVHTVKRFPAALLVTSRGCTGKCIFCDRSVYGNRCTYHSADYVIRMVKDLKGRYGIREIQFRDDNFLLFKERLLEICRRLIDEKIDIAWSCAGRVDMINAETLKLMKRAGCWEIWYGIESGCDDILKIDKKDITVKQIESVIKLTNEAKISACGFFIIGHPGETEEDLKKTLRFLLRSRIADFHSGFMTPFPGSELYYRYKEFGTFDNDWKKLHGWVPVFIPYNLTREVLEKYSKKMFLKFYVRPRIIFQYLARIIESRHVRLYCSGFLAWCEWVFFRKPYEAKGEAR